jgi:transcriptional regulator with XRE-family HTH domain
MTTHYAEKAKELRTRRAWSQEQLAAVAGINVRTIQRIERGDGASFETLKALANAFDVDVSELLAAPLPPEKVGDKQNDAAPGQKVEFLGRVRAGRELFGIVAGTHMHAFDHDELQGAEVNLVATALRRSTTAPRCGTRSSPHSVSASAMTSRRGSGSWRTWGCGSSPGRGAAPTRSSPRARREDRQDDDGDGVDHEADQLCDHPTGR